MNKALPKAPISTEAAQSTPPTFMLKRIGNTTYQVGVHFSQTSTETMSDKVLRLVKNEAQGKAVGT